MPALDHRQEMRVLAALAVQPFLAALIALVGFRLFLLDSHGETLAGGRPVDVAQAAFSVAFGVAIVAAFVSLVGVLPTAGWLMKRRRVSLGEAVLFGLGFANLPILFGTLTAGAYGVTGFVRIVAFASMLGVAGATAFWFIALRETPQTAAAPGGARTANRPRPNVARRAGLARRERDR